MTDDAVTTLDGSVWISTCLDILDLPASASGPRNTLTGSRAGRPSDDATRDTELVTPDQLVRVVNDATYYRLTPSVWAWVCQKVQAVGSARAAGRVSTEEFTALQARFERLRQLVIQRHSPAELAAALATPQQLPDREQIPPTGGPEDSAPRDENSLIREAVEQFLDAERERDGGPDYFDDTHVHLSERALYVLRAPPWMRETHGPYLVFDADAYEEIAAFNRAARERHDRGLNRPPSGEKFPPVTRRKKDQQADLFGPQ